MPSTARAESLPDLPGATLTPLAFSDLEGWAADDHEAAFRVFRATCARLLDPDPALRPGLPPPPALLATCRAALEDAPGEARAFFERRFLPLRIRTGQGDGTGFLTGYYEPEVPGSLTPDATYSTPVLGRPPDLVTLKQGESAPGLDPALAAARRTPAGLEPYPDRGAIWDGALAGQGLELLYLADKVELFMAQVQGSARVRLPDGRVLRLVYAGRNGRPYTSIGKVVVSEGRLPLERADLAGLKAWLRANPEEGERVMRLNRSYIFFALGEGLDPDAGPIGGASVPLTPLRSIAVDRALWPYGLPFWIRGEVTLGPGASLAEGRLWIAQDTGSAILGPARADLFIGSGDQAGLQAGGIRHRAEFTVLWPRALP
ncbi:MAG: MltA domain-containing protein [Alsobacter sp.]